MSDKKWLVFRDFWWNARVFIRIRSRNNMYYYCHCSRLTIVYFDISNSVCVKYRSVHVRERRVWLPRRNQRCTLKLSTLRLKKFDERDRIQTVLEWDDVHISYIIYTRTRYTSAAAPLIPFRIHPITKLKNFSPQLLLVLYNIVFCAAGVYFTGTENPRLKVARTPPKNRRREFQFDEYIILLYYTVRYHYYTGN